MRTKQIVTRRRRAVVLICIMACLVIISALAVTTVRMSLLSARHGRLTLSQHQADWLLRAGVQRAIQKQSLSGDYDGEIWRLPSTVIGNAPADILIESLSAKRESLEGEAERSPGWLITARLLSHDGSSVVVQRTHALTSLPSD